MTRRWMTGRNTRGRQVSSTPGVQDDVLILAGLADPSVDKVPLGVRLAEAVLAAIQLVSEYTDR
jgi:hypothetical protein